MSARATSFEMYLLEKLGSSELGKWLRGLRSRKTSRFVYIFRDIVMLGLAAGIIWLLFHFMSWVGVTAFFASFFVVSSYHEWGHYRPMVKAGIIPERVGVGIPFGPFKYLQLRFNPRWLPENCELWVSPITFMFLAYVEQGEQGMEKIKQLDRQTRAKIYGGGVANNLVMAAVAWAAIQLLAQGGRNWLWWIVAGLAVGLAGAHFLTDSFRLKATSANYVLAAGVLLVMVYLGLSSGALWRIPASVWALVSLALILFVLQYKTVVTYRIFPVLGLLMAIGLGWLVLPNLAQNFSYASSHGGALPGQPALMLGARSLTELMAISGGEPTVHITELLGSWSTEQFVRLSGDVMFILYMLFAMSLGLALTNLLPLISVDGGHLWGDMLDPDYQRPWLRRLGLWLPTAVLLPTLLVILVRTELNAAFQAIVLAIVVLAVAAKLVRWRVRSISYAINVRRQLASIQTR